MKSIDELYLPEDLQAFEMTIFDKNYRLIFHSQSINEILFCV